MMKTLRFSIYALMMSVLLFGCAGEDGDPGPAGDQGEQGAQGDKGDKGDQGEAGQNGENAASEILKVGSLTGHLVGTRRDGVAFDYPFSYEYTYSDLNGFYIEGVENFININRQTDYNDDSYFSMRLMKSGNTLVPAQETYGLGLSFRKELDASTLFYLQAQPSFEDYEGNFFPMSLTNNAAYGFQGNGRDFYLTDVDGETALQLYISGYSVYYLQSTGRLIKLRDYNGTDYTSGAIFDKYNAVKFLPDPDNDNLPTFYRVSDAANLGETIPPVPADTFTVTNYNHDPNTGILSFDFTSVISGYNIASRSNTTNHTLTITGTYNSGVKVYANTVGRQK